VKKLIVGYDNRFGHDRTEGFEDYVRYGQELGIEVIQAKAYLLNGVGVSSSMIRSFLQEGEVELAEQCLGYPYFFWGKVVEGEKLGRQLGFPTANLELHDKEKLIPAPGVYAVNSRLESTVALLHSMMNIGSRPTFGGKQLTMEVHILEFEDDLYGKDVAIGFLHRIRSEQKFASADELREQLLKDKQQIEEQFEKDMEE